MVTAVAWLSLTPHPPSPPAVLAWDKAQHFVTYAFLMYWFRQAFTRHWRWPAFLVTFGIGLEMLQGCTELRVSDPFDIFANTIGVVLGLGLALTPLGTLLTAADARLHALTRH